MFAFNRSALAVLVPLALLVAVAMYSNRSADPGSAPNAQSPAKQQDHTVAANLPSR
jgi:hypothetical protein